MKRYFKYLKYVLRHKFLVFAAGYKLDIPIWTLIIHDLSKFSPLEFIKYAKTFYSDNGESTYTPSKGFDNAWLHHQKVNKHHWQAWVLLGDDGSITALPIPQPYVHEMVADSLAMSVTYPGALSPAEYYIKNRENMIMHPDSQYLFEVLLNRYADLNRSDIRIPDDGVFEY